MKQTIFTNIIEVLLKLYILAFCLPYYAVARDFLSSVENASNEVRQIIAVVGVLALDDCRGLFLLVKETWNGKIVCCYYRDGHLCSIFYYLHTFL